MGRIRIFKPDELIFDEYETREILKFFFTRKHAMIESADITDHINGYAQGILVEAVDASYAMGFIEIIFKSVYLKPLPSSMTKIVIKLGKKALVHWFKHAKATDLTNIKIYESVRNQIEVNLEREFELIINGLVMKDKTKISKVAFSRPTKPVSIWNRRIL